MRLILFTLSLIFSVCNARNITVSTSTQFQNALNDAQPGDIILLADANYKGPFKAYNSGLSANQIRIKGSRNAVISSTGYGFHLMGDYWILTGIFVIFYSILVYF